jgi:peptidoglycan/LPS O-acetylase OafA/YrhL
MGKIACDFGSPRGRLPRHLGMKIEYFNEGQRIPSVDGMRAVAIGTVIFAHALGTRHLHYQKTVDQVFGDLGSLGVRVFFVISGFLITSILLRELEQTGTLSLKRFYLRRGFRIFPASYAFLGIMLLVNWIASLAIPLWDWVTAATYTINYNERRNWYLSHCWSLAVEEQFYLLWPWTLKFLGRRKGMILAGTLLAVVPLLRGGIAGFFPEHRSGIPWEFHTVCDGLATGCLLAGFQGQLASVAIYRKIRTPFFAGVAVLGILLVNSISNQNPVIRILIGPTLVNLQIAWLLDIVMTHRHSLLGRLLNSAPMVFVGVLSYSLYLWQQPFLTWSRNALQSFPLNVALALAAACGSYYLVERPFLRLRKRLEPPGHPPVPLPGPPAVQDGVQEVVLLKE